MKSTGTRTSQNMRIVAKVDGDHLLDIATIEQPFSVRLKLGPYLGFSANNLEE